MKRGFISRIIMGVVAIGVTISMLGLSSYEVLASDVKSEGISILDEINDSNNSASDTKSSLTRGNNLNYGTIRISELASNKVGIYGLTQCHRVCSKVYLNIYLEQKRNGSYYTYDYWNFSAKNVSSLSKSLSVLVPSGYYYRLRGTHVANNGAAESVTTLTDSIYVGNTIEEV